MACLAARLQSDSQVMTSLQVCVPINPEEADSFDPVDGVPTVSQLLTELDRNGHTLSSEDMQVILAN